ncbi:hypothetical protein F183_A29930 [Bryobacterales bacterium F-183]|nr:hypothetical protein F183_A29930 [Bryobacterales bacterium F-183]
MCQQPIPPMSKMAKKLTGNTMEDVVRQMPVYAPEARVPVKQDEATGGYFIELCMSCWIHTGEGNRR